MRGDDSRLGGDCVRLTGDHSRLASNDTEGVGLGQVLSSRV